MPNPPFLEQVGGFRRHRAEKRPQTTVIARDEGQVIQQSKSNCGAT